MVQNIIIQLFRELIEAKARNKVLFDMGGVDYFVPFCIYHSLRIQVAKIKAVNKIVEVKK